jgi:uncharacterized protein (TIGR03663 family)
MKEEAPGNSGPLSAPWNAFFLCFVSLLAVSLVARLYGLDERLLHHDESMLAAFSWQLYDGRGYQYNPLLHGPFSYYLNAVVFFLFGVSDYTTRLGQAFFGVGLVALVYSFRAYFSRAGILAAASLIGLGPTFLYFTRFGKSDPYLIFFFVLFILFCLRYDARGSNSDLYGAAASLSLQFCTKENAYLYLGIAVSFLGLLLVYRTLKPNGSETAIRARWQAFVRRLRENRWPFALGFLIFWAVYILLYSSFLTHPGGVLDGLYRKSVLFWFGQHVQPGGWEAPFSFYLPLLIIYEAPVVIFIFYGLYRHLARGIASRIIFLSSFGLTCILALSLNQDLPQGVLPVVHIEKMGHLVIALYALGVGFWATFAYLKEGRTFRAFVVYWSALSFAGYSSIWVKAPWFFVHVLFPMIFLAALSFGDFWESEFRGRHKALTAVFIVLLAALTVHNTVLLNYRNASDPRERMVTAQTSPEFSRLLKLIDDVVFRLGTGYDTPMAVKEVAAWPMGWYLRSYRNWYHPGDITVADKGKAIIIGDWNERETLRKLLIPDYVEMQFPHRGWCIPDAKDLTFQKIWRYFVHREPFNSIVHAYLAVYVRRDLAPAYTL